MKKTFLCGAIAGMMAMGSAAQAVIMTTAATGPNGMFAVSSTDLLQTNLATAVLTNFAEDTVISGQFGSSEPKLRDGGVYNASGFGDTAETLAPVNFSKVTYSLDVSTNTLGYDLTSIISLTGTGTGQDRAGQIYDILISVVGDASLSTLYQVSGGEANNVDTADTEVQVTTIDNAGLLATGVDVIQIIFVNDGNESMYREFDVLGTATAIPEPSSVALLALASICTGLGVFRRRR